ncbi:uroporphyrinogen-III synthase [Gallaecimonas xiamenensis]|uniref:Uroporphyrinogen-III synthase n=1 Tax=Gallaecimonas xiamenensis 3-C-1 TaxID=745411 RepID=K2JN24_9GAMM|nr:uroporphyrinogen-III synthase [Gallaecimonas xiamenensis]EKE75882.1 uroporphyrinogen-III synthase [Gallaecimonas xiamenensis 3-C-1]
MSLLIVRPQPQAERLAARLAEAAIAHQVSPLLTISPVDPAPELATELADAQWVVAVSVHAVAGLPSPLPKGPRYAAVGEATAQALREAGADAVLVADPPDSEGLLAQPALAKVQDERILIARGNGGRELLAKTLAGRGAQVQVREVYRRQPVHLAPEQVLAWQDAGVDQVQVTSCSLLDALLATTPPPLKEWLLGLTLLVPSARVAEYAQGQGFSRLVQLKDASDEAIIHYFKDSAAPMTDNTETPKTPAPAPAAAQAPKTKEAPKGNSKVSVALALLALLLGAGALGLSGWTAYQQWLLASAPKAPQVDPAEVSALQSTSRSQAAGLAEQSRLLKEQDQALAKLRQQLLKLQQDKADTQSWPREEAAMLVRMANRRLYLSQDLNVAKALLRDADNALRLMPETSELLAWRQAIAADLANLAAQADIDRTALAMRLAGLSAQVAKLPLNTVKLPDVSDQREDLTLTQDSGDWRDNLSKSWQSFADNFIKIRKREDEVAPLMSPSHEAYLREALALALNEAKLAMFAGDQSRYQASLRQVRDWLDGYADSDADATKAFVAELDKLLEMPVSLSLPGQLDALRWAEAKS